VVNTWPGHDFSFLFNELSDPKVLTGVFTGQHLEGVRATAARRFRSLALREHIGNFWRA
jgi:hypothetical protein